ncbi:DUF7024 domain-containing protein [Atlantibacter hermannii]|uniref:DUF7024 domain-containing protein n=1 Tax=Atlantibacter hermannii TaxID=565 RepID=UPI00289AD619|nr:hypothetical protein [Atlantibacter hermannii]
MFAPSLAGNVQIQLKAVAFGPNTNNNSQLKIGDQTFSFSLKPGVNTITINADIKENSNTLTFIPYKAISPAELGVSDDSRKLGIGFIDLKIIESY